MCAEGTHGRPVCADGKPMDVLCVCGSKLGFGARIGSYKLNQSRFGSRIVMGLWEITTHPAGSHGKVWLIA